MVDEQGGEQPTLHYRGGSQRTCPSSSRSMSTAEASAWPSTCAYACMQGRRPMPMPMCTYAYGVHMHMHMDMDMDMHMDMDMDMDMAHGRV